MKTLILVTALLSSTSVLASAKPSNSECEKPYTESVVAEDAIVSGSSDGVVTLRTISKAKSIVMTREFGMGTYNTVTLWLKDTAGAKAKFYALTEFGSNSSDDPNFSFAKQTLTVSGDITDNSYNAETGLYSPVEDGTFKTSIMIGAAKTGVLSITTISCQK